MILGYSGIAYAPARSLAFSRGPSDLLKLR